MIERCPVCDTGAVEPIFGLDQVPVFNNVLYDSRHEATAAATGPIDLRLCAMCGLLFNQAFDAALVEYEPTYSNSLHHSAVFRRSAEDMAARLAQKVAAASTVVEIGCGTAEFLLLVTDAIGGRGLGFDPSLDPAQTPDDPRLDLHPSLFVPPLPPDTGLVVLQQVLEHLLEPRELLGLVRRSMDPGALFYVDVPNATFMVDRRSYLDVIYEHPLYFGATALRRLAADAGFSVDETGVFFGDQFLWADLRPHRLEPTSDRVPVDERWIAAARDFGAEIEETMAEWAGRISRSADGGPAVIWGAGSKGISLLNVLDEPEVVQAIVDINPEKQGRFTAVTGHQIVGPDDLAAMGARTVFTMNPNYVDEITATLVALGVEAEVLTLW